jgi:predicted RNA-binding Zn-ribbon protein involved in translation (DUF1610 family)
MSGYNLCVQEVLSREEFENNRKQYKNYCRLKKISFQLFLTTIAIGTVLIYFAFQKSGYGALIALLLFIIGAIVSTRVQNKMFEIKPQTAFIFLTCPECKKEEKKERFQKYVKKIDAWNNDPTEYQCPNCGHLAPWKAYKQRVVKIDYS